VLTGLRPGTAGAAGRSGDTVLDVPVVYDGQDLAEVADILGCSADEVVRRHTGTVWTVAFCGFAPGFGYLTDGTGSWDVPRRSTPRTTVPAGAVALAGEFSGVYPRESPGGWQLIGRTRLQVFDLDRDPPALLAPLTRVRFVVADP
jgi:KipI family sensor histidine kinase inhibitor